MNTKNTQQIMKTVIAVLDLLKNCFSIKEVWFVKDLFLVPMFGFHLHLDTNGPNLDYTEVG